MQVVQGPFIDSTRCDFHICYMLRFTMLEQVAQIRLVHKGCCHHQVRDTLEENFPDHPKRWKVISSKYATLMCNANLKMLTWTADESNNAADTIK